MSIQLFFQTDFRMFARTLFKVCLNSRKAAVLSGTLMSWATAQAQMMPQMMPQMQQQQTTMQSPQWGSGLYGGNQACAYNTGTAPGATSEDDEITDLKQEQTELKQQKRDGAKQLRDLEGKKSKYEEAISDQLKSDWADAITAHMEDGGRCDCQVRTQPQPDNATPSAPGSDQLIHPGPPLDNQRPPGFPNMAPISSTIEYTVRQRGPADMNTPANPYDSGWQTNGPNLARQTSSQPNPFDQAAPNECSADNLHASRAWHAICQDGGGISKNVCHNSYFRVSDAKAASTRTCDEAIGNYHKVTRQIATLGNQMARMDDRIKEITDQIKQRRREIKEDGTQLESNRPAPGQNQQRNSSSTLSSLLPLAAGVVGGLGAEYLAYRSNQTNNNRLTQMGYPTQSYQAGSVGYPFVQAGIYGSIASGQSGAFGCSQGVNGMNSPYGNAMATNPYGMTGNSMMNPSMNPSMGMPGMNTGAMGGMTNPYASMYGGTTYNPYASTGYNPYASTYGSTSYNPYASTAYNPYASAYGSTSYNPYSSTYGTTAYNPYASLSSSSLYGSSPYGLYSSSYPYYGLTSSSFGYRANFGASSIYASPVSR